MKGSTWSVRRLLAASAAFAAGAAPLASAAEVHAPAMLESIAPAEPVEKTLNAAQALLRDGKPVHARAILLDVLRGGGAALSDADRQRAMGMLSTASSRIRMLSPVELSLQKASLSLSKGDLGGCLDHVAAVLDSPSVGLEQVLQAELLQQEAEARRTAIRRELEPRMRIARDAMVAQDYETAFAEIRWIDRSGLDLSDDQHNEINDWRMAIIEDGSVDAADTIYPSVRAPRVQPEGETPGGEDPINDVILNQPERDEALRLIEEADQSRAGRDLQQALELYERVNRDFASLLTDAEFAELERKIEEVTIELANIGATPGDTVRDFNSERATFEAQFETLLEQARRALDTGDFRGARAAAARADVRIDSVNPNAYLPEDFENFRSQVQQLQNEIDNAEASDIAARNAQAQEEAARRADEAEVRRQREQQEQIDNAILRVREFQLQQEYRQALDVIESEILAIEPRNPTGLLLRELIQDTVLFTETQDFVRQKQFNVRLLGLENDRAAIPPLNIIDFPPDWPALSFSRGLQTAFVESPANRQVFAKLDTQRVPQLETDRELEQVLAFIASIGQFDIDVDWEALEDINIDRNTRVSLNLRNKPLRVVLERALDKVSDADFGGEKAWYAVQDGVVVVSSDTELRKNTYEEVYDVRDLILEIPDYDNAPEFDLNQILQSSRGGGGQSPFRDTGDDETERVPFEDRMDEMKEIIRALVDPGEWREDGGQTGAMYDWQGQLIVTQTADNHRDIRGLLSKLRDQRAMQINVETRFLLVSQDFFEQIGFDLDVYFNAESEVVRNAQAGDANILPSDFFQFGNATTDGRGVVRQVNSGTGGASQPVSNPTTFTPIATAQNTLGIAGALIPAEGIAATILGGAPALGVAGTFLDDIQVDFLVQATQADTRSVTLTAPRLTFTNGQRSNIFVVTQIGFVSDLQPVVSDSAVGFDPTIDVISEGVRMVVDGTVTADRRFVQMNIDAAVAQIEDFAEEAVTAVAGGQLVNSADTQSFVQIPTTTVTRVQTTVTVPDQGTILLGGQRIVSEFEVESGIPVLSKIPILNRFFSNRISTKEESTLLILVKPTVLIQSEQEERAFPGLSQDLGIGG